MRPPKCKICGHEHYGVEHVWDSDSIKKTEATQPGRDRTAAPSKEGHAAGAALAEVSVKVSRHGRYADLEKRRTYMREYMRKRRKKSLK